MVPKGEDRGLRVLKMAYRVFLPWAIVKPVFNFR
jgi:hypothetical protein